MVSEEISMQKYYSDSQLSHARNYPKTIRIDTSQSGAILHFGI